MGATEVRLVLAMAAVTIGIRLFAEMGLRGREPPRWMRDAYPWLPVMVAGTFVALLHFGAAPALRLEYLVAAAVGCLTLVIRRTFYGPMIAGALTVVILRTMW